MTDPPRSFFDELARLHAEARAELEASGAAVLGFDCVFGADRSWWGLKCVRVLGEKDGAPVSTIFEVDPSRYRRPIRRVKR